MVCLLEFTDGNGHFGLYFDDDCNKYVSFITFKRNISLFLVDKRESTCLLLYKQ